MNAESNTHPTAAAIEEVSKWGVGAGILTVALAPLAIPILALTAVALLPLLVPVVALGLIAGLLAAPVALVRRLRRRRATGPEELPPHPGAPQQLHQPARLGVRPG